MTRRRGHDLIVLFFLTILLWHAGRAAFPDGKPPAFQVDELPAIYVWLGEGFGSVGVRQYGDDMSILDVMELTDVPPGIFFRSGLSPQVPVLSGQCFSIEEEGDGARVVRTGWMTAARRMALGIPLHPDRMKREDWHELKGVGPVLAERIEAYRQENGEFGSLERLQRVKGIGPKRIEAWKRFF